MKKYIRIATGLIVALVSTNVMAGLISNVTATATSEYPGPPGRWAMNAVNYTGLSTPVDAFANPGTVTHNTTAANMWLSTYLAWYTVDVMITFDLGAVYTVSRMHIWNYNENVDGTQMGSGASNVTIRASEWGQTYALKGDYTLAKAPGTTSYTGEDIIFSSPITARYIQIDINSNYGGGHIGLSEVQFDGVLTDPDTARLLNDVSLTAVSTAFSGRVGVNSINYSGLSSPFDAFANPGSVTHGTVVNTMWVSAYLDSDPYITYDLGGLYTISKMHVWNYNEVPVGNNHGVNALALLTAEEGAPNVSQGNFTLTKAPGAAGYTGEDIEFGQPFDARHIKFDINSSFDSQYYGLSEVQFLGVPVLPSLIAGVTATASSSYTTRTPDRAVNGSGLSVWYGTSNSFANIRMNHGTDAVNTMWLSNAERLPDITFDLGRVYIVSKMHVWNYNEAHATIDLTMRGVSNLTVYASEQGAPNVSQGNFTFAKAPTKGSTSYAGEEIVFAAPFEARYIKFDVNSNWGDTSYTGLSEVQFAGELRPPRGTVILLL